MLGLRLPRKVLDERITVRVARMWADGLVDEVRELDRRGLRRGRTASRALGYAQALAQLDGHLTEAEAMEQTATATRRYARRQESWFGPDQRIHWVDAADPDVRERALALVRTAVGDNGGHG
jgi:tRNA dimethylallyltransferase